MVGPASVPFWPYKAFFVYIEPLGALLGAFLTGLRSDDYLNDLLAPFVLPETKTSTPAYAALGLLANLWLLWSLNEYLVLSGTTELKTWRRLLTGLLVADIGHLVALGVYGGPELYWQFWRWNALGWGNIALAYFAASTRICFLLGLGIDTRKERQKLA